MYSILPQTEDFYLYFTLEYNISIHSSLYITETWQVGLNVSVGSFVVLFKNGKCL